MAENNGGTPTPTPTPAPQAQPASGGITAEQLAASIVSAIETRNQRSEGGIIRSYAEQSGMTEAEVKAILDAERARRAAELTPEQQKTVNARLEKANERLISAEIKSIGASFGLVDADAAAMLMDRSKVKVKDDGTVEGVKESIEALKKSKPYLFGAQAQPAKTGMRQRGSETQTNPNAEANEAIRALFGKES